MIFRNPLMWGAIIWFVGMAALGLSVAAVIALPDKWDKAVALKICRDGTPILRLQDGSIWARRNGFTAYRVENEDKVC
jgi:hypothetical protein